MIPQGDGQVIKEVTLHYCRASLLIYCTALAVLYFTEFYLLAGRREYLHLLSIFIIVEIFKWLYHRVALEKDTRLTYKKKPLSLISLLFKSFDVLHLLKTLIVAILGSFAFHFLSVVFGADIFSKYEETFVFSLTMSVLTVFPLCLNFGISSIPHLLSGLKPTNCLHQLIFRNVQCTLLGAWGGAVVIPLDWDRPWQLWPVPCSLAAIAASSFSYVILYLHMQLVNSNFNILKKVKFC